MIRNLLIGWLLLPVAFLGAQEPEPELPHPLTRILFVFDVSQSMVGQWGREQKFTVATRLFGKMLDSLATTPHLELALRVYGDQVPYPPGDCHDTRLVVPFGDKNIREIKQALKGIRPLGITPIAYSLSEAANDFPRCEQCRNILILITDGIEECTGDPCEVSALLQQQGIILKPFVIGIGKQFREQFDCVGSYFDARDENEFREALRVIISRALNPTTVQVNLLDARGHPTETNLNMTFFDHTSGKIRYNLIHAMNAKGYPDTLEIDPLSVYDLVVHSVPPVRKDSIWFTSGIHNTVGVDVPQGFLAFRTSTGGVVKNLECLIRRAPDAGILNVQPFDVTEKYLTGRYEAEVLCMPRMTIRDIEIRQNHTTTVEIPSPGIVVIQTGTSGYGSLYLEEKGRLTWLYNLKDTPAHQETLYLLPGSYRVVFRSKYINRALYTIDKAFEIRSGQTTNVKLYGS